ncbi:Zinc carboxypeptidase [Salinivirga cyanobacteriivorans]|uniref:Zinc carboxypeptidase n=1 Tax=Salinivirga cyanobacteriivorans TaxID=1307839 RepID=A0A0S2I2V1_9BACT|nr:M14 family zinc carboxypeptidase [Salinivirga cyanobacteriivorans]ALO16517.1 Zinc carboxypeptidase [Salinivirga cyanobacteriivorans]
MKTLLFPIIAATFLFWGCDKTGKQSITYPIQQNNFSKVTTHKALMTFLQKVDTASDYITVKNAGHTSSAMAIPLVKIQKQTKQYKPTVFIIAQQHGNEPSGKEAALALIAGFANKKYMAVLDSINLLIMPQVNPWGNDHDERRTAGDFDLNRDHLVLATEANRIVHRVFHDYKPEITIDVHEYYPYRSSWEEFGYIKNFDVQLGGPTNPNINHSLFDLFYDEVLPYAKNAVEDAGYSFFEYTLGQIHSEGGRLRHSTTHIDDGRQSFGIMHSFPMIIEGKNGKTTNHNLERRTKSQLVLLESLIAWFYQNATRASNIVTKAKRELKNAKPGEKVGIRFAHIKGKQKLAYPLRSIKTDKDTIFMVKKYHSVRKSTETVDQPKAYLIPKDDFKLNAWLQKHHIEYENYEPGETEKITQYTIQKVDTATCNEGWDFLNVKVNTDMKTSVPADKAYIEVPTTQLAANKLVLALEPRSMLALLNDTSFHYLIEQKQYKILRVE